VADGRHASFRYFKVKAHEHAGRARATPRLTIALPESSRQAVREEVQARLAEFESSGRLVMSVEMLIGAGRV
jgi:hypothetical protein